MGVSPGWEPSGANFASTHATRPGNAQLRNCTRVPPLVLPIAPWYTDIRASLRIRKGLPCVRT